MSSLIITGLMATGTFDLLAGQELGGLISSSTVIDKHEDRTDDFSRLCEEKIVIWHKIPPKGFQPSSRQVNNEHKYVCCNNNNDCCSGCCFIHGMSI